VREVKRGVLTEELEKEEAERMAHKWGIIGSESTMNSLTVSGGGKRFRLEKKKIPVRCLGGRMRKLP